MKYILLAILLIGFPSLGLSETIHELKINTKGIISLFADLQPQDFQYISNQLNSTNKISSEKCQRFGEIVSHEQDIKEVLLICFDGTNFLLFKGNYSIDKQLTKRYGNQEKVIERYPVIDDKSEFYKVKIHNIFKKYFSEQIDLINAYMRLFN